jgi:hypothetical protein
MDFAMDLPALNAAHNQSPSGCALERVSSRLKMCSCGSDSPLFAGVLCGEREVALPGISICGKQHEVFALACVSPYVSLLMLGHCFGAYPAPGGTRSSASLTAPFQGHGSSQKKFENHGKEHRANFFRAPPRKQTFGAWEPGPLARLRPV